MVSCQVRVWLVISTAGRDLYKYRVLGTLQAAPSLLLGKGGEMGSNKKWAWFSSVLVCWSVPMKQRGRIEPHRTENTGDICRARRRVLPTPRRALSPGHDAWLGRRDGGLPNSRRRQAAPRLSRVPRISVSTEVKCAAAPQPGSGFRSCSLNRYSICLQDSKKRTHVSIWMPKAEYATICLVFFHRLPYCYDES